jgi:uncharacterized protein
MKDFNNLLILSVTFIYTFSGCSGPAQNVIRTTGKEVIAFKVLPFELTDVKLLDGLFLHAAELNVKTLKNYDPDRLLSRFYSEAGMKPKADHYMCWENESLAGHSPGHPYTRSIK